MFHVKQKEAVEIDSNSLFLFLRATSQAGILHAHLATAAGSLTNIHHPGKFQSDSKILEVFLTVEVVLFFLLCQLL